jgi:hypothetical protein
MWKQFLGMMSPSSAGRPFSTLNLIPFLWLRDQDSRSLHSVYLQLSLKFHPDRIAPELKSDRAHVEQMESIYSLINADYQDLKNQDRRIERVISEFNHFAKDTPTSSPNAKMPPDLAIEYFEVIENPEIDRIESFQNQGLEKINGIEKTIGESIRKFPFRGTGTSDSLPWNQNDIEVLKNLQSQKKYLSNIVSELKGIKCQSK